MHFPLNVDLRPIGEGEFRFGVRPSHISLVPSNDDDLELAVTVEVAEISGSETFLHVRSEHFLLVLHLPGVHEYDVDAPIRVYIPTHKLFVFDGQGRLVQAPDAVSRGLPDGRDPLARTWRTATALRRMVRRTTPFGK